MLRRPPPRGFPDSEFEARLEKAQALMAKAGLSVLLLSTEAELRYFSGFLTQFWQSPTRPWFMVVPLEGKPVAIIPEIGAQAMGRTWLEDIRTWASPHPTDDGTGLLADALKSFCPDGGTVGTAMGAETHLRMPLGAFETLKSQLEARVFRDATGLLSALRMVKSAREIEKIRHICGIASDTFAAADHLFFEGQPLEDSFRAFKIECLKNGADDVAYLVGAAGQNGYEDVISPPTTAPLQRGDVLMLDTGAMFDGYFCDFDRNYAIGHTSETSQRGYETLWQATEAGLLAAKPGATCAALFRAMQSVIGQQKGAVGRLGHGLGMQLTEWPSHTPWETVVLKEGMVLTLEPSMSLGAGRMMVHEEDIVICEGGAEVLSRRAPRELPVIGS